MLERTTDMWTTGILNIPVGEPQSRFLFFEIDTKDSDIFTIVANSYHNAGLDVYWHETGKGYHYYSLNVIDKYTHWQLVRELKPLNMLCPLTTLRIKANRYVDEIGIWKHGNILLSDYATNDIYTQVARAKLAELKLWIEHQSIGLIKKHYSTVKYPFPEVKALMEKEKNEQ